MKKRVLRIIAMSICLVIATALLLVGPFYNIHVGTKDVPVGELAIEPISISSGESVIGNVRIEANPEARASVYAEGEGTKVTINSGYFDGGDESSAPAVYARDNAKIIINDGTFKAGEGNAVVYAKNSATVEINGGFFEADGPYLGTYFVLNLADNTNSTIIVKGGTFVNFNPADNKSENPAVSFVPAGYGIDSTTKDNGDVWYTVKELAIAPVEEVAEEPSETPIEPEQPAVEPVEVEVDYTYDNPTSEKVDKCLGEAILGAFGIKVNDVALFRSMASLVAGLLLGPIMLFALLVIKVLIKTNRKAKKMAKAQSEVNKNNITL